MTAIMKDKCVSHKESANIMYTHIGKRKTYISVSIAYLFRRHEINRSYLWSLQLQEVLKVVAAGFQTFKCTANYHLGKVCYLNTC